MIVLIRFISFSLFYFSIMQVPGSDNAGPGSDILGPELMSEGIKTLLEKRKQTP